MMKYQVTLNGKIYEVEVEKGKAILTDEYEAAAPQPVAPAAPVAAAPAAAPAPTAPVAVGSGEPIASPLPGTVTAINVKQGDAVKKGQILVIIEAMKMENEIVAPRDGSVTQVVATAGKEVTSGDVLIVLA